MGTLKQYAGFAVSSEVAAAPITAEMAAAKLCAIRRTEKNWANFPRACVKADLIWTATIGQPPLPANYISVHVVEKFTDPDLADAVAYHTVTAAGDPICFISWEAVQAEGGSLTGPDGLLSAIVHEILEALIDPDCRESDPLPAGYGDLSGTYETSREVCDWLQGSDYEELPDHYVANASTPSFFGLEQGAPYDNAAGVGKPAVTGPFQQTDEGYHDVQAPDGTSTIVTGDKMPAKKAARVRKRGPRGGMRWAAKSATP